MTRQFPPRTVQQRQEVAARLAFDGSLSGSARNAAQLRAAARLAASAGNASILAANMFPAVDKFVVSSTTPGTFALTFLPRDNSEDVTVNGITLLPGTDWTRVGTTLTIDPGVWLGLDPADPWDLEVQYWVLSSVTVPISGGGAPGVVRLYLSDVSPAATHDSGLWDFTSGARDCRLVGTTGDTALTTYATPDYTWGTTLKQALTVRAVSDPLPAQTLAGTMRGMQWASQNSTAGELMQQVVAYVVSGDGATLRGYLLNDPTHPTAAETEFDASGSGHQMPVNWQTASTGAGVQPALSPVSVLDGDRVVVEMGFRRTFTSTDFYSPNHVSYQVGNTGAADIPWLANALDATARPWVEFDSLSVYV